MPLIPHRFLASKKLYAVDRASFTVIENPPLPSSPEGLRLWSYQMDAVWFSKRNNGRRAAFFGKLWDHASNYASPRLSGTETDPTIGPWLDADEFLQKCKTGRYGANPSGCWDGAAPWWAGKYADDFVQQQAKLPFLQDMLNNYPNIPSGFDGWYAFSND